MSRSLRTTSPRDPPAGETRLDLEAGRARISVVGVATAVIALVAVIGMVYVAAKALGVAERAVDRIENVAPQSQPP